MCERWKISASTKHTRIRALERILGDALHVRRVLSQAPPPELRILNAIALRGTVTASDLLSVPALFGNGSVKAPLTELAEWGFVMASPHDQSGAFSFSDIVRATNGSPSIPLFVPEQIGASLPDPPPLNVRLPEIDQVEVGSAASSEPSITAFLELLRVVDTLHPRVTHTGTMHRSDESRALELAREVNVSKEALRLALTVARELGYIVAREGRLHTTPAVADWANLHEHLQIKQLFHAHMRTEDLPELEIFFPQLYESLEEHLPLGSIRRTYHKQLLELILGSQPSMAWYRISDLVSIIFNIDRNLLFLEERWRAIQLGARDASAAWKDRNWQNHERRLFEWLVRNVLAGLGVVEISASGESFRVTPLGAFCLGSSPPPPAPVNGHTDAVTIQPDFEIIAYLDRCSPGLRRKLDLFCDRIRSGPVSTYRFTRESYYRGMRSGESADGFLDFLGRSSSRGLPANVRDQVATWQRKFDAVILRVHAQILEFRGSDLALQYVEQHPEARLLGDRFVMVDHVPEDLVLKRIDYVRGIRQALQPSTGLQFRVPWDSRDLFIGHALEELCTVTELANRDTLAELTASKLKPIHDWGLAAAQLESLLNAPLPARYRAALRTWAGESSGACSASATLVRFDDAQTCDAVMELPEAAAYIVGRLGLFTVIVQQGRLAAMKKTLRGLGIPVKAGKADFDDGAPSQWALDQIPAEAEFVEGTEEAAVVTPASDCEYLELETSLPSYSPRITSEVLEDAIRRRKPVLIAYQSRWSPQPTVRRVNPVSLDILGPAPSLSGFCHQHGGARTFKLAHIRGIRVLDDEDF